MNNLLFLPIVMILKIKGYPIVSAYYFALVKMRKCVNKFVPVLLIINVTVCLYSTVMDRAYTARSTSDT